MTLIEGYIFCIVQYFDKSYFLVLDVIVLFFFVFNNLKAAVMVISYYPATRVMTDVRSGTKGSLIMTQDY